MLRLILIVIVGIFVAIGLMAVALYHFLGIKGLIIFPFVILALLWIAKWLIKNLVKKFALSLFGLKARVLRGATMNVHSIRAIPEPPESKGEADSPSLGYNAASPSSQAEIEDEDENECAEANEKTGAVSLGKKEPRDYVELDVTITPKPTSGSPFWEPGELILTSEKIRSLPDLEEKSIGATHSVEIWDGSAFGPDDSDKYPGEQRLKIIFEVKQGTKSAWLSYYHEAIGQLELPVGTVEV